MISNCYLRLLDYTVKNTCPSKADRSASCSPYGPSVPLTCIDGACYFVVMFVCSAFFFIFPNLFAICIHTFKYNQQIVRGRDILQLAATPDSGYPVSHICGSSQRLQGSFGSTSKQATAATQFHSLSYSSTLHNLCRCKIHQIASHSNILLSYLLM
jgi:hypothetical protein